MLCTYTVHLISAVEDEKNTYLAYFKSDELDFQGLHMMLNKAPDETTGFSLLGTLSWRDTKSREEHGLLCIKKLNFTSPNQGMTESSNLTHATPTLPYWKTENWAFKTSKKFQVENTEFIVIFEDF